MVTERRIKSSTGAIVKQQNWAYSNSNRLLKTISGNLFEEFYGYDSIGNISDITDNLNNVNQLSYDGLNRVSKEIDALNGEVTKTYDTASRINTVTDQRGNQTTYTLDGFNNVIRIDSPDTGITDMWYDEADNMTKKVLADGTEINYVYDASNRLIDILYRDSTLNVHFDYDTATYGKGKIALITYKHGSIAYTYNELGLVDSQTNIVNNEIYLTNYQYTNWGALSGITYPSGRQVDYILDSLDRVTGISVDGQTLISNVEYLPFGSFKSFDYGNGISFIGTFDKDYLVRNVTHTNAGNDIFNETYGYEKMYQINTITDNLDSNKNQIFTYDAKSQLINATGNYGDYEYTLDPVGNRLSKTVNMIDFEFYNVDTLSNKLLSVDKGSETRTLNYDAKGNIIEDIDYDLISKTLTYGDNNRLVDVDGYIYGYNPMNQKVIDNGKINNYDLNGQLISVNDGNLIIEYIYLGNMKIAMFQDNGIDLNTYYAHNNYMGLPRLFTDENKNIVWNGDFTPFGELFNENGYLSNLVRFIGQYENIETGYFYNYHRDYDASLGRYLQSDPIGLNGGINTYAYVAGNPINFVDPNGLDLIIIRAYAPNNDSSYGHTWITHIDSKGNQNNYGLWPDFLFKDLFKNKRPELALIPDFNSDVRKNVENNKLRTHEKIFYLPDSSIERFLKEVNEYESWYAFNNCTDWSVNVINNTFNENIFDKTKITSWGITYPELLIEEYLLKVYK